MLIGRFDFLILLIAVYIRIDVELRTKKLTFLR